MKRASLKNVEVSTISQAGLDSITGCASSSDAVVKMIANALGEDTKIGRYIASAHISAVK